MSNESADDGNRGPARTGTWILNWSDSLRRIARGLRRRVTLRERLTRLRSTIQQSLTGTQRPGPARSGTESAGDERAEYVAAIVAVDDALDRPVRAMDIETETPYSLSALTDTFGGWQAALDAAGIDRREQILTEIRRLERTLGHQPSPDEMNEHGHVSATVVENTLGSYEQALEAAAKPPGEAALAGRMWSAIPTGTLASGHATGMALARAAGKNLSPWLEAVDRAVSSVDVPAAWQAATDRTRQVAPSTGLATVTDAIGSVGTVPVRTTDVRQDRRRFLKYAGTSTTLAIGFSSSDALFGNDSPARVTYGYGGAPLDTTGADTGRSGADSSAVTPTPSATPRQTATPVLTPDGSVDNTTDGSTDNSTDTTIDNTTDGSTDNTTDGSVDNTTNNTTDGSTDNTTNGSIDNTSDTTTDNTTDGSTDDTTDSGATTETPTTDEQDRYFDGFDDPDQGYGEAGYGGVAAE